MNKKGFIATSILYSFFIVFCAMLLTYIGVLGHNSILVNKEKDLINEELHSMIYLSNAKDGDYFRLNVCSTNDKLFQSGDTINYYLIKYGDKYVFVSSTVSFKLNSYELLKDLLNKIYINYKGNKITSRSMSKADYDTITAYLDNKLKNKILNIDIDYNENNLSGYYLLANNPNNFYNGSYFFYTLDNKVYDTISNDNKKNNTYIRLTFDIDNNYRIISGDGTYSNPYIIEGGASCN